MKHKYIIFFVLLSIMFGQSRPSLAQECYWSSHIGGNLAEGAGVIGSDNEGNVYIFGSTQSQVCYFNPDSLNLGAFNQSFFVKYDGSGNKVWIRRFSGPSAGLQEGYIAVSGILDTTRNVILGYGHFYNNLPLGDTVLSGNGQTVFIFKMDLDGNVIWARTGGGIGLDFAMGLTYDEQGNIYMSGCNEKEATFGETTISRGGFLAKYTTDGNLVWVKNKFRYFVVFPSTPYFPFTEAPPFNLLYSNNKLLINGDIENDTIIIDTITIIKNSGYISSYLASFDTSGNIEWIKPAGRPEGFSGKQFTVDSSGDIYITGNYYKRAIFENDTLYDTLAGHDCFIAKYHYNGAFVWAKQLNSDNVAQGEAVLSNGKEDVYLAGMFSGKACFGNDTITSGSGSDMFLACYSGDGICKGVRQYSLGSIYEFGIDQASNVLLAGSFQNTLTIGPNTFTSYGDDDIFVAKCSAITGLQEKSMPQQTQLLIYANPTTGKCNIKIPEDFRHEKNLVLQIFDNNGRMIQNIPVIMDQE